MIARTTIKEREAYREGERERKKGKKKLEQNFLYLINIYSEKE